MSECARCTAERLRRLQREKRIEELKRDCYLAIHKVDLVLQKIEQKQHWCGCITQTHKDGVRLIKICPKHRATRGYVWIALQHKEKEKQK